MNKIVIELTLLPGAQTVGLHCRETRTEYPMHAGVAPISVASLVKEWLDNEAAEGGYDTPADPLEEHEIRNAQWNALRQGNKPLNSYVALGNIRKARR